MSGKFLSLEEAARLLGVSVDEVQRLVDRKQLFPIRDGSSLKFRADEIERQRNAGDEATSWDQGGGGGTLDDDLTVDLDLGGPLLEASAVTPEPISAGLATGGDLDLDEPLLLDDLAGDDRARHPGSGGAAGGIEVADDLALSGGDSLLSGSGDEIDSIIASGGSAARSADPTSETPPPSSGGAIGQSDDLSDGIDLGDLSLSDSGSGGLSDKASLAKSGDGGLELDAGAIEIAGIELGDSSVGSGPAIGGDLEIGDVAISDVELSGDDLGGVELAGAELAADDLSADSLDADSSLGSSTDDLDLGGGGDDFDLGTPLGDDESASQIVELSSESADGSFFGDALGGAGSSFGDASGIESFSGSLPSDMPLELSPEMRFSGLQIAGLISCSLLMLLGGFMAYDLVRTIGSSEAVGNPVLDALAQTFGWR